MKKTLSAIISILILASIFSFGASAASNSTIAFSANTVTIGNKVTVTVTLNSDTPIYAYEYKLNYDATKLSYPNFAGVIHDADSASGEKTLSFKHTFTSIAVGAATFSTSECIVSSGGTNETVLGNSSATLTIKDVQLPANANLSSLSLSVGKISPNFTANRTNYTASVPFETTSVNVFCNTADQKAKVGLNKPAALNVGENTITLTVTAQNGTQKVYTIVVTRRKQGEAEPITPETPDNNTDNTNPYETVISGKNYEIATQIPEENFLKGFTLSTADFNGVQVPVIKDTKNEFTVYYLKEAGTTDLVPYTYNNELQSFEVLKYITSNQSVYIFCDLPQDTYLPNNYYQSVTQVGSFSVKSYLSTESNMSEFSYIYCYVNGDYGLYCYDSKEGTIQRAGNVHLLEEPEALAPAKDNFATRFNSLSTNGKLLLIAMLVAALCVILLIIFLIVMAIKKLSANKQSIYANDEIDFDEVLIVGEEENKDKF